MNIRLLIISEDVLESYINLIRLIGGLVPSYYIVDLLEVVKVEIITYLAIIQNLSTGYRPLALYLFAKIGGPSPSPTIGRI